MYHFKKEKQKVYDRLHIWQNDITNALIEMFTYDGYDKGDFFRFWRTFEDKLIHNGEVAVIELDGELYPARVSYSGDLDAYGDLTDAIVYTDNGKTYTFKNWRSNDDIVVVHNNYLEINDSDDIARFASILSDIDKSIKHNVIFSRFNPILVARNETEKKRLELALAENENGKLGVIVSDVDAWNENGDQVYTADITSVKDSDKIQYLNKCHDDIMRRLATKFGVSLNSNTSKMAQQSVEEITSGEDLCKIMPFIRFKCRTLGVEEINRKFGYNITVTFSPEWDRLLKKEEEDNPTTETLDEAQDVQTEEREEEK